MSQNWTGGLILVLVTLSLIFSAALFTPVGLEIEDADSSDTLFGNIEVYVEVNNLAPFPRSGVLVAQVSIDGEATYTKERSITVPAGASNSYSFGFDIPISVSIRGGNYTVYTRIK